MAANKGTCSCGPMGLTPRRRASADDHLMHPCMHPPLHLSQTTSLCPPSTCALHRPQDGHVHPICFFSGDVGGLAAGLPQAWPATMMQHMRPTLLPQTSSWWPALLTLTTRGCALVPQAISLLSAFPKDKPSAVVPNVGVWSALLPAVMIQFPMVSPFVIVGGLALVYVPIPTIQLALKMIMFAFGTIFMAIMTVLPWQGRDELATHFTSFLHGPWPVTVTVGGMNLLGLNVARRWYAHRSGRRNPRQSLYAISLI